VETIQNVPFINEIAPKIQDDFWSGNDRLPNIFPWDRLQCLAISVDVEYSRIDAFSLLRGRGGSVVFPDYASSKSVRAIVTPGKAAIVYHAGAGRRRAVDLVAPVRRHLEASGWRVVAAMRTRTADHARQELVPWLSGRADLIVVMAGDGTLRDVCAGLGRIGSRLPIGFIPTGNANVVARDQGIPLQPEQALAVLTSGRVRPLDVGMLRTAPNSGEARLFLAMVEVGLGAQVVHLTHRLRYGWLHPLYRRWGDPVYAAAALQALLAPAEHPFRIYRDESPTPSRARAAVFANTRCYAKGWAMAPDARMDDGRLDLVARRRSGAGVFLRACHAAWRARRPPASFSWCARGRRFRCESDTPMTIQLDGDPLPDLTWMEIKIVPNGLRLITPS
jgi:diacylglycerol kinase (ATP)